MKHCALSWTRGHRLQCNQNQELPKSMFAPLVEDGGEVQHEKELALEPRAVQPSQRAFVVSMPISPAERTK